MSADKKIEKYNLRINDDSVYYSVEQNYRDIRGGMDLLSIVSLNDNCQEGSCCENVGEVLEQKYKLDDNYKKLYCFRIQNIYKYMVICDIKKEDSQKWRNELINHIVNAYLRKYNLRAIRIDERVDPCKEMLHNWE